MDFFSILKDRVFNYIFIYISCDRRKYDNQARGFFTVLMKLMYPINKLNV